MPKPKQSVDKTIPYRVRDRYVEGEPLKVWGENLSYDDAVRLKEKVVTSKQSRTARLEPMSEPLPGDASDNASLVDLDMGVSLTGETAVRAVFTIEGFDPIVIPASGLVTRVPANSELVVNDQAMSVPAPVHAGDRVQCRALDPELVAARAKALAAARPAPAAKSGPRVLYRDRTVKQPQPRTGPPPRDKTVSKNPVHVRLDQPIVGAPKPLASPLKVATQTDGAALPDDALYEDDLHDLAADIGGNASDADMAHAKQVRDQR